MRSRVLHIAVFAIVLCGTFSALVVAFYAQQSRSKVEEAKALLNPPFQEAPRITDIAVSEALALLDRPVTPTTRSEVEEDAFSTALNSSLWNTGFLNRLHSIGTEPTADRGAETWTGWLHYAKAIQALVQEDLSSAQRELERARKVLTTEDVLLLEFELVRRRGDRLLAAENVARHLAWDSEQSNHPLDAVDPKRASGVNRPGDPGQYSSSKKPTSSRLQFALAEHYLDGGAAEKARSLLRSLLRDYPDVSLLHQSMGLALEQEHREAEAEIALRQALERDSRLVSAWIHLGRVQHSRGHYPSAQASFSRALEYDENAVDAWLGRGSAFFHIGAYEKAELDFRKASELARFDADPWIGRADVKRAQGHLRAAVKLYQNALEHERSEPTAWVRLGNVQVELGELEPAISAFESALRIQPELGAAHNGLGAARMRLGQYVLAEPSFRRAAVCDSEDPNPWLNLALLQQTLGRFEEACVSYGSAVQRLGDSPVDSRFEDVFGFVARCSSAPRG
ncbi:MAG: tetratricopeptide repeat protein [Myxococcota bacterium]